MHRRSLNSEPWPLNCAMCRCSSCVGRKSSWDESLPGLVATWVTQDCRHESSERDRAGWKRNAESLASSQSLFWQSGFLCSVFFLHFHLIPAAFSNTPSLLSTPLSSGSLRGVTSHCTLHSSVCHSVLFTQAFHFSDACTQSEEASLWTAESYSTWVWRHAKRGKQRIYSWKRFFFHFYWWNRSKNLLTCCIITFRTAWKPCHYMDNLSLIQTSRIML